MVATKEKLMSSLQTATVNFVRTDRRDRQTVPSPSHFTARLAADARTRSDAFALRHASYVAGGYIDPRPGGLFSDPYDDKPNCSSLVVYKDDRPVASVRLCVLDTDPAKIGWDDIPAAHVFEEEVDALVKAVPAGGRPATATEINRLVRHPDFATDYELVFILFRFVSFMVLRQESDMMLSCVRRNHMPFYKRLEFGTVAGPRAYPELKFATNLMACPKANYGTILNNYEILNSRATETGCYDGLFRGETVSVFEGK
jgi:hypothetical protein